ncbi:MAG: esterase family protein [Anaerolineales bacterium]|nr:esterase family protein [Anaerolineales bacterium]
MAKNSLSSASELCQRLEHEGNPLIDGERLTFVWEGQEAPQLICDLEEWENRPRALKPVAPGLYACSLELPLDAYLEYRFRDPQTGACPRDPRNPRRTWNGLGNYNHYVYLPQASPSPLTRHGRGVPRGDLTRHTVATDELAAGQQRTVHLYNPLAKGPVPLLVVYDGNDYLRRGKLAVIVDNLIAQGRIRPIAMALVDHGGPARMVEYACSEATISFLVQSILPLARQHLSLLDPRKQPGAYGVLGASMGGLMAVYTALRLPQVFGRALSQAGAFVLGEYETIVLEMVRHAPKPAVRLWLDAGRMDFLLEANRRMRALLESQGYDLTYVETGGAHNYTTWRNVIPGGLEEMFG